MASIADMFLKNRQKPADPSRTIGGMLTPTPSWGANKSQPAGVQNTIGALTGNGWRSDVGDPTRPAKGNSDYLNAAIYIPWQDFANRFENTWTGSGGNIDLNLENFTKYFQEQKQLADGWTGGKKDKDIYGSSLVTGADGNPYIRMFRGKPAKTGLLDKAGGLVGPGLAAGVGGLAGVPGLGTLGSHAVKP